MAHFSSWQFCSCRAAWPECFTCSTSSYVAAGWIKHKERISMALLEVQGITKRFGGLTAVSNLDLNVDAGHIVALIGPNGAGKTTAFNVIAGFYKADGGKVIFDGKDITDLRPDQICKLGLARTFQVVRPF